MTLETLKINSSATIKNINLDSLRKRRLQDMGITEGTKIKCVQINLWESLFAYNVRGAIVALRYEDIRNIEI